MGLAVLLIVAYALGMLFSLKTHRELFASAEHGEEGEAPWPIGLALATLAGVTVLVALVSEIFVESVQKAAEDFGMTPAFVGFIVVALVGGAAEMASAFSGARKNRLDLSVGIALGSASQIALFVAPVLVLLSYVIGPTPMDLQLLAGRGGDGADRHAHRVAGDQQRALGVVRRRAGADGLSGLRDDAVPAAAAGAVRWAPRGQGLWPNPASAFNAPEPPDGKQDQDRSRQTRHAARQGTGGCDLHGRQRPEDQQGARLAHPQQEEPRQARPQGRGLSPDARQSLRTALRLA